MFFLAPLLLGSLSPEWRDMMETSHLRAESSKVFHFLYIVWLWILYLFQNTQEKVVYEYNRKKQSSFYLHLF